MSIQQPSLTDKQNSPDHSLSHRVFANDNAAPVQSVTVDANGDVTFKNGLITMSPTFNGELDFKKTVIIYVGQYGDYGTLKEAVDAYNNDTVNMNIILDAETHAVQDTITVNNPGYKLKISGLGSDVSFLEVQDDGSQTISGKPMFIFSSDCDINSLTATGSGFTGYGDAAGEDFIQINTALIYTEISDIFIDTFMIGISDLAGADIFVFNFEIEALTGIKVNYTTDPTASTTLDVEVGNFYHCPIAIDLLHNHAITRKTNFYLSNLIFKHQNTTDISIKYVLADFLLGEIASVLSCATNNVGTFMSGFDYTNVLNSNVEVVGNGCMEDKLPHCKINIDSGTQTTTITTSNVYYKAAMLNGSTYACKFTLDNGKITYLSDHVKDGMMWLTGNMSVDDTNRNLQIAIRQLINVTSVIGNGTTVTVTTSTPHHLVSLYKVQMLGWNNAAHNGTFIVTVLSDTTFRYTAGTSATSTGGSAGALYAPTTVRTMTTNQPFPFALSIYTKDMSKNDVYEIYVSSANGGDIITIQDVCWLVNTR